jgi:hypothetical protein
MIGIVDTSNPTALVNPNAFANIVVVDGQLLQLMDVDISTQVLGAVFDRDVVTM